MGTFAETQLKRQGWKRGEGLGKNRTGISAAVKVARKKGTQGVGTKGENFEFAWWDHVYNKVLSSVRVDNANGEVKVQLDENLLSRNQMGIISTDLLPVVKPRGEVEEEFKSGDRVLSPEQLNIKRALYGYFVKSFACSTKVERSFEIKIGDQQLFEACNWATAGKGIKAEQNATHNGAELMSTNESACFETSIPGSKVECSESGTRESQVDEDPRKTKKKSKSKKSPKDREDQGDEDPRKAKKKSKPRKSAKDKLKKRSKEKTSNSDCLTKKLKKKKLKKQLSNEP